VTGAHLVSTQLNSKSAFDVRNLDGIPIWKSAWRKWITFRTVSQSRGKGPFSQDEFIARWTAIQQQAARTKNVRDMTPGFWKMESLGSAYGARPPKGHSLADSRLPVEVRPIAHTGMGVSAVEVGDFDVTRIADVIESLSHPDYRLFAYESIGAMLGAYEVPFPKRLVGLKPLRRPDPERFIARFAPEIQWQISSGYGRVLYFNNVDIASALRSIRFRPYLEMSAAVQGVAFACAMINHEDFWMILEAEGEFADDAVKTAYRNGLIYALVFWEWETPGFLRSLRPHYQRSAELIAIAQGEIDRCLVRGKLNSFVIEYADSGNRTS
jgi:hypothetical protein